MHKCQRLSQVFPMLVYSWVSPLWFRALHMLTEYKVTGTSPLHSTQAACLLIVIHINTHSGMFVDRHTYSYHTGVFIDSYIFICILACSLILYIFIPYWMFVVIHNAYDNCNYCTRPKIGWVQRSFIVVTFYYVIETVHMHACSIVLV